MDFAVPQMRYGKVQSGLTPTSASKRVEEEKGGPYFLPGAGLSSCLYMLCAICAHLSMLGVVSTLPHYIVCYGVFGCLL
jgi:hypothetical protein